MAEYRVNLDRLWFPPTGADGLYVTTSEENHHLVLFAIAERLERQNELMVEFIQAANTSRNVCPKCGSRCHCR